MFTCALVCSYYCGMGAVQDHSVCCCYCEPHKIGRTKSRPVMMQSITPSTVGAYTRTTVAVVQRTEKIRHRMSLRYWDRLATVEGGADTRKATTKTTLTTKWTAWILLLNRQYGHPSTELRQTSDMFSSTLWRRACTYIGDDM